MSNSANTQRARYTVTGIHPVLGHQPGATFTAVLSAGQEAALVQGGAIRRVPPKDESVPAFKAGGLVPPALTDPTEPGR